MACDPAEERTAPSRWSGAVERTGGFLLAFAVAIASAIAAAWTSQTRQDEEIKRNAVAIAVIEAKLDAISAKLDEIRAAVLPRMGLRSGPIGD